MNIVRRMAQAELDLLMLETQSIQASQHVTFPDALAQSLQARYGVHFMVPPNMIDALTWLHTNYVELPDAEAMERRLEYFKDFLVNDPEDYDGKMKAFSKVAVGQHFMHSFSHNGLWMQEQRSWKDCEFAIYRKLDDELVIRAYVHNSNMQLFEVLPFQSLLEAMSMAGDSKVVFVD
ncbi:hypothetical protein [Achromobacter phage Motura]|uniref:Uncharacterized protein n=1 Tax=Achromobacter phage Motura TaxID=2591403 RepID=A0A514CSQ2_9CAUD|nr:hypothetical protein H1O15_gp299 [Achromobacter phage Motura]QDH83507.1 hypothetical protein [Achromobacter phage Motura]